MINKKTSLIPSIVLVLAMIILPACSSVPLVTAGNVNSNAPSTQSTPVAQADTQNPAQPQSQPAQAAGGASGIIAAYQGDLQDIYTRVNPSVVAIHVVSQATASSSDPFSQLPGFNSPQGNTPQVQEALGSGFVWDTQGHIITNNHVVSGAQKIDVTFSDGTNVPATLVGADPDSDLAVIKVDVKADMLQPVTLADSTQVKVGQLAIALGNPFGLENTMTVGIVSALGRSLPANENSTSNGPTYTIPDIIQTDAPINPGNSGGVLLDASGQVIGVTAAIESPSQANAGIGFVIPSQIVGKVVPALIKDGKFVHPWLGISGASLNLDLASAMKLISTQRGVLVATVTPNSPASKAGLQPSNSTATINGQSVPVGGDVITAINGQPTNTIEDLIAYLAANTEVGQKVEMTLLRNGKEQKVEVTLEARPTSNTQSTSSHAQSGQAFLGIKAIPLNSAIIQAMNLPANAEGLLIQQVEKGSPAEAAGLIASSKSVLVSGKVVMIGGDILVMFDSTPITSLSDLQTALSQHNPGDQVTLTIVRDGQAVNVDVTLAANPM